MRFKVNYCSIVDVEQEPENEKVKIGGGNRKVTLQMQEEDFFEMLDSINPKNIVKYLDMRMINHREAPQITLFHCEKQEFGKRNTRKLNRVLSILDSMRDKEKL
jgi:hypothetical protein